MRYLEVRRHSKRSRPNQHLTQWGVALARGLGSQIGPFDRVVTSPLLRCVETAVAMGFAVDETIGQLAGDDRLGESFPAMDKVDWSAGCAVFQPLITADEALADFVATQAEVWRAVVEQLPKGGQALLVGHAGAFLCGTAVYCLPEVDHSAWGAISRYCEGIRLHFDGQRFSGAEILKVKQVT